MKLLRGGFWEKNLLTMKVKVKKLKSRIKKEKKKRLIAVSFNEEMTYKPMVFILNLDS
jgi:hypothetical protein